MKAQILTVKRFAKYAPLLVAMLARAGAGCLAGCGAAYDRDVDASLVERQGGERPVVEWKPSSGPAVALKKPDAVSGQAAQSADSYSSAISTGNGAYKIGPLDVLDISVFKAPDLSKTVQVSDLGTINLPLVNEVPAAGKTAQEVERDLTARLGGKYLKNPQVTVYVKEYNSQRATIEGAVKKPGVYPIKGKTTLLQFIAMAESMDRDVASSDVAIFRVINGKRCGAMYDISEIRSGNTQDPAIQQGDVIVVDTSISKVIFNGFAKVLPITSVFVPLL
jgi:polysaccharide export outer membrane protein